MQSFNGICFVTKREAQALLAYASEDAARPISAIYFDAERNQVCATNGHQLAVCKVTQGALAFTAAISRATFEAAVQRLPRGHVLAVHADGIGTCDEWRVGDGTTVIHVDGLQAYDTVDGYPRYYAVLGGESTKHAAVQGFAACYLADLNLVARACEYVRKDGKKNVRITPCVEFSLGADALAAARWSVKSTMGEWFGMLMPVRL